MDLRRLPIKRLDDEVLAVEGDTPYSIINPQELPEGVQDGIFTVDREHGTAKFESMKAYVSFVRVRRSNKEPGTITPLRKVRFGSTVVLVNNDIRITIDGGEVIVDAPTLPHQVQRFLGALALEGLDLSSPEVTEALQYVLKA